MRLGLLLGGELAEALGDLRFVRQESLDFRAADRQATDVRLRPDSRRAFDAAVDETSFPEDVAGPELAAALGSFHDRMSSFEHEHARAGIAALDEHSTCRRVELARSCGEPVERFVRESLEQRHRA
jgi:hypothetical protein